MTQLLKDINHLSELFNTPLVLSYSKDKNLEIIEHILNAQGEKVTLDLMRMIINSDCIEIEFNDSTTNIKKANVTNNHYFSECWIKGVFHVRNPLQIDDVAQLLNLNNLNIELLEKLINVGLEKENKVTADVVYEYFKDCVYFLNGERHSGNTKTVALDAIFGLLQCDESQVYFVETENELKELRTLITNILKAMKLKFNVNNQTILLLLENHNPTIRKLDICLFDEYKSWNKNTKCIIWYNKH